MTARVGLREKHPIILGTATFVLVTVFIVAVNSLLMGGLMPRYSVSRYAGSWTWSALLFLVCNCFVALWIGKYLYILGEKWRLPKIYCWIVVVMVAGLIGLSVCPMGYFDATLGLQPYGTSMPSHVHEVCSRLMFSCMLILTVMLALCGKANKMARGVALGFIIYGIICALAFIVKADWFMSYVLLFESCYVFWFLIFCLVAQTKEKEKI